MSIHHIKFTRVDGRMIHGQVAIAWTRLLNIEKIIVISSTVLGDEMKETLLELACPSGIDLEIYDVDGFCQQVEDDDIEGNHIMLIFEKLNDLYQCAQKGIPFKSINIGGMYFENGKTQYEKALCLDTQDEAQLKGLIELGCDVFYQVAPMNEKEAIQKYVK